MTCPACGQALPDAVQHCERCQAHRREYPNKVFWQVDWPGTMSSGQAGQVWLCDGCFAELRTWLAGGREARVAGA